MREDLAELFSSDMVLCACEPQNRQPSRTSRSKSHITMSTAQETLQKKENQDSIDSGNSNSRLLLLHRRHASQVAQFAHLLIFLAYHLENVEAVFQRNCIGTKPLEQSLPWSQLEQLPL